jgi:hypothetical protein
LKASFGKLEKVFGVTGERWGRHGAMWLRALYHERKGCATRVDGQPNWNQGKAERMRNEST